jgi:hypothetical protein
LCDIFEHYYSEFFSSFKFIKPTTLAEWILYPSSGEEDTKEEYCVGRRDGGGSSELGRRFRPVRARGMTDTFYKRNYYKAVSGIRFYMYRCLERKL